MFREHEGRVTGAVVVRGLFAVAVVASLACGACAAIVGADPLGFGDASAPGEGGADVTVPTDATPPPMDSSLPDSVGPADTTDIDSRTTDSQAPASDAPSPDTAAALEAGEAAHPDTTSPSCTAPVSTFTSSMVPTGFTTVPVPSGCGHAQVNAVGGNGGTCAVFSGADGGLGADVTATVDVTGVSTLDIFVGGAGQDSLGPNGGTVRGGVGGANGGGSVPFAPDNASGSGGGGSSEVAANCPATSGTAFMCGTRFVVAGGGGGCGAGFTTSGGGNAGSVAGNGDSDMQSLGGGGATLVANGQGAPADGAAADQGFAGSLAAGGAGGVCSGGGGGGYRSGGGGGALAGCSDLGGGGAGSSYAMDPSAMITTSQNAGEGQVTILWTD